MNKQTLSMVALAASGLMLQACSTGAASTSESSAKATSDHKCSGPNGCDGKDVQCVGQNKCKGMNACKGQGWVKVDSKEACEKLTSAKPVKKAKKKA